jgi:hypothetical protein
MNHAARRWLVAACLTALCTGACGDDSDGSTGGAGGTTAKGGSGGAASGGTGGSKSSAGAGGGGAGGSKSSTSSGGSGGASSAGTAIITKCAGEASDVEKAVCAATAFLEALSSSERDAVQLELSDAKSRTLWSNLPGKTRAGMSMGNLSSDSQAAGLALMQTVLSESGMADLAGVRAADDYLGSMGSGSGPGGSGQYSASNYSISVFGTPSATGDWALAFGGHHMAFNLTFKGGDGYPTPNHLGCEPKASFSINGSSYEPLSDESKALLDLYKSLSSDQLSSAYLSGQTFADVLIGPVEYDTGSLDAVKSKYPTGDNRKGVKASALSDDQRALIKAVIDAWVGDYQASVAQNLRDVYTSTSAFEDTLIAWGGTQASGVDPDVNGTYMRIDGPRVWIEVSCQNGVVIQGKTHYHTIFRDKEYDYGGSL